MHNLDTDETKPITNVITGIQQIDVNRLSNKIVFSGYKDRGWDLFLIDNPTTVESKEIPTTVFYATKDEVEEFEDNDLDFDNHTIIRIIQNIYLPVVINSIIMLMVRMRI